MRTRDRIGFLLLAGCLAALPAQATDGVREINQACVATGCFPGDLPGFPVQIVGEEGSYRLTSNLVVPIGVSGGIAIGSKVDLDLNGFVIRGPGTCLGTGGSVSCVGLSGYGVVVNNAGPSTIRNGLITGVSTGVDALASSSVALSDLVIQATATGVSGRPVTISIDRVRVEQTSGSCMFFLAVFDAPNHSVNVRSSLVKDCHDSGIALDPGTLLSVSDTELVRVGNLGIVTGEGASIRDVRISAATSDGLVCGRSCSVERTHVLKNGGRGIVTGEFSEIVGNKVGPNGGTAIVAGDGSTLSRNTVFASDVLTGNKHGIQCQFGCGAFENVIRFGKNPLSLGADSRSSRNVMSLYENPPSLGVSAGDNLCSGTDC